MSTLKRIKALGGDDAAWIRPFIADGLAAFARIAAEVVRRRSASATPRPSPTAASCRSSTARAGSRSTCEPYPGLLAIEAHCLAAAGVRRRDAAPPTRRREVMTKARTARHQAPRRHPLLRARPRALAPVLHREARLRRDLAAARPSSSSGPASARRASRPATIDVVCSAPVGPVTEGGAAPRGSSPSTPTASARWCSRSRTPRARSRCSRSAAARRSTTSRPSSDDGGTLRQFSITTPFGDTTFRFRERRGYRALYPGAVAAPAAAAPTGSASSRSTTSPRTSRP